MSVPTERILRVLSRPGAHLEPVGTGYLVRAGADRRRAPAFRLTEQAFMAAFDGVRLIKRSDGSLKLDDGMQAPDEPQTASPRVSPLDGLLRAKASDGRPYFSPRQLEAVARLLEDHRLSLCTPGLTVNWAGFGRAGQGGGDAEMGRLRAVAARRSLERALRAAGDLRRLLECLCFDEITLASAERQLRLKRGAARPCLRDALERLCVHYSETPNAKW